MASFKVVRGEIWLVDFEPQTHKEEPGKRARPALVIQTNLLNQAGHPSTMVIPATTQIYQDANGDGFPLRVPIGAITGKDTDLLIDQIRTISNRRFMQNAPVTSLSGPQMKRVEQALKLLLNL
jgi:mRNA interferase MazF